MTGQTPTWGSLADVVAQLVQHRGCCGVGSHIATRSLDVKPIKHRRATLLLPWGHVCR